MIAERIRSITRAPRRTSGDKAGAQPEASKPELSPREHLIEKLEAKISLLAPNRTCTGRTYYTLTYYSSLYQPGEGCPTLTTVPALEVRLKTGEFFYVTTTGLLVDQTMCAHYMAPLSPRDYVFRHEGLHGEISKEDQLLKGLIRAIGKAAKTNPPKQ